MNRRAALKIFGTAAPHEGDVWTLGPNPEAKHRVLTEHEKFFLGMKG